MCELIGESIADDGRVRSLRASGLLDSQPEVVFDRLTKLTCRLLGVPVALVSLVDLDRQFFKSAAGLPEPWASRRETPLTHSFCQHVVTTGRPLMVTDSANSAYADNKAVSDLGVAAYLGVPLVSTDGHILGALCAIDSTPRDWTPVQANCLQDLASLATGEIRLRQQLRTIVGSSDPVAVDDATTRAASRHAMRLSQIGELSSGIVHDVGNVLNAISGNAELAKMLADSDPAAMKEMLDAIQELAQHGANVSRRILGYARKGAEDRPVSDLARILGRIGELLAGSLGLIKIQVKCPPGRLALPVSETELETVLMNLAINGRDAMPKGGTLTLSVTVEPLPPRLDLAASLPRGPYCGLCVADTGTGMDSTTLARATEPFFTTKGAGKGTGLGLSLARDFADRAGGCMTIESAPGLGTNVTLWLPLGG